MINDDQQPDIYSFPGKEAASSESEALDDALLDAVDGIAQSLRDDERSMREQERLRRQRQLLIFGAIFFAIIAVPLEHFTIACMGTRSGLPRNRIFLEYQIDVYITGSPESIVKCSSLAFYPAIRR